MQSARETENAFAVAIVETDTIVGDVNDRVLTPGPGLDPGRYLNIHIRVRTPIFQGIIEQMGKKNRHLSRIGLNLR